MGRIPCCEKDNVKRGQWTPEEDNKLASYIAQHGTRNWRLIPKHAGLQRCGKSCRLRWTNYLRPDLKHGEFTEMEEQTIIKFHAVLGNRWSIIAAQLPGRTDNDVKNHWNTKLKKRLSGMGIDPVTHKPFSHLMAEIATALPPPQVAHLAEAALGCFKDEMLHFLTKKRSGNDFGVSGSGVQHQHQMVQNQAGVGVGEEDAVQRIRMGLSRAMMEEKSGAWEVEGMSCDDVFQGMGNGFQCDGEGSEWSTCVGGERKDEGVGGADGRSGKGVFGGESSSDCVLWDLTDDIMNL